MFLWGSETALVGPDQNRKSHDPAPHQRGWVHSPWTLTNWEVTVFLAFMLEGLYG